MYWPGDASPFGEGHNSAGVVTTATHWGLAEGRVGGPHQFQTYILLANPETTAAEVTVTFLRENGAPPVVKTYTVPATSRFNIDLATVPELQNESFGARIDVTNGVEHRRRTVALLERERRVLGRRHERPRHAAAVKTARRRGFVTCQFPLLFRFEED